MIKLKHEIWFKKKQFPPRNLKMGERMKSSMEGFQTSWQCLQHPGSWISIGLLLINDHIFKALSPNWLTGKLSDFAGLFYFPFLVALFLSPLLDRWKISVRTQGKLVFLLVGVGFVLLKTAPPVNQFAVQWVSVLLRHRTHFVLDPTDVFALLVFFPGWQIWNHPPRYSRKEFAFLSIFIAMLATVATSPSPPEYGIYEIKIDSAGELYTQTCNAAWVSQDGGLSWKSESNQPRSDPNYRWPETPQEWILVDDSNPQNMYRFVKNKFIEYSQDGGQTWQLEFQTIPLSEAQQEFYRTQSTFACVIIIVQGPWQAVLDPKTGNLVISMGVEGVLVRFPDGKYQWVTVGTFEHVSRFDLRVVKTVTIREVMVAITLMGFTLLVAGLLMNKRIGWLVLFVPLEAIYIWYILNEKLIYQFSWHDPAGLLHWGGTLVLVILYMLIGLRPILKAGSFAIKGCVLLAITAGLGFWLPFFFWSTNFITSYSTALGLAFAIFATVLVVVLAQAKKNTEFIFKR